MVGAFCAPSRASALKTKADEEAAGVPQKNCGGIEVEAQETENRAGQGDGHHRDQGRPMEQRHHERHQSREQGRSGGQTIEAVNQVERVGDGQNPHHGECPAYEPGQTVLAEQHRDVDDPQTTHEQHGGGDALHGKLEVRTDAAEIVVYTEQKDERRREQR